MALIEIHRHYDDAKLDKILKLLTRIGDTMATQQDVDRLTAKIEKVKTEVVTAVDALREQVRLLQEQIDSLDNLNPDAPTEG